MDRDQLIAAVEAQERLRGSVPDDVVDATIDVLRRRLHELDAAHHRRRHVTVLFADVRGYTAMSERLDAERVTAVMNDLWARLDQVIVERSGTIDKHIGDAVMAVWGGNQSAEDDAEQAVHAAFGLLGALRRFCDERKLEIQMRIGVHTGRAVLGAVGSAGEVTAMGDTVNVASRLEHAAPVGGILVSHDTYRHVRGVFDVRALEPIPVHGRVESVRIYEVLRAKPRAFRMPTRGVEGIETRMIGRDRELDALRRAFLDVAGSGGARLVTVVGEAGIGKSRLLYEFDNWLEIEELPAYYFKGRATPRRRRTPLGLLRDAVAARCLVQDSDPVGVVRRKLAAELGSALDPRDVALASRWLGFDVGPGGGSDSGADRIAQVGRASVIRYLSALAATAPVVVLLEDLHWADDESLDALEEIVRSMRDHAVLVVAATRPELFDRRPRWGAADRAERVDVDRLTATDGGDLVQEVLQEIDRVPDDLVALIAERSEGNPFFVEELVKMLVDDGVIQTGDDGWTVRMDLVDRTRIPSTLMGVLQTRLDALPAHDRSTLQRAAVIGRIFWSGAVAALDQDGGSPVDLEHALARELVHRREPSTFAGTDEFIFRHALLHDVAYEAVLLRDRPALHAAAADWIERVAGERVEEYLVEIGEHRRRAGQRAAAVTCFEGAARAALAAGAVASAHALALTAIEMCEEGQAATCVGSLVTAASCSRLLGRLAVGRDEANRAIALARALGDEHLLVTALVEASRIAEPMGDHATSRALLLEALPLAERTTADDLASTLIRLAWSDLDAGEAGAAGRAARGLELAEQSGSSGPLVGALAVSSAIAAWSGDFRTAILQCERAVEASRRDGDVVGEVMMLSDLGVAWHLLGDTERAADAYAEAERAYRRSLDLARELGLDGGAAIALANLAQLAVRTGDAPRALAMAGESLAIHIRSGALVDALMAVLAHAEAMAACGDVDTAVEELLAVQVHPAVGSLREEVSTIRARFEADHQLDLDREARRRDVPDFDAVVRRILDTTS